MSGPRYEHRAEYGGHVSEVLEAAPRCATRARTATTRGELFFKSWCDVRRPAVGLAEEDIAADTISPG